MPQTSSGLPATPSPSVPPSPLPERGPSLVPPRPSRPRTRWELWGLLIAALGGAAWYWQANQSNDTSGGGGLAVRTYKATAGRLESVMRLTGVTVAENAASLLAPQLRGSRGGSNREASGAGVAQIASVQIQSRRGGNTSPGAASSTSLSPALQAATSRTGGGATSAARASTASTAGASTTMGSDGIGTSAAELTMRSQGGGGGGNDFNLVLQELVKPGSPVKKGDVVAEFDRQNMLTRLDDYKASVIQSEASVRRQQADLAVTRKAKEQDYLAAKGAYEKAKLDMKTIPVLSQLDIERTRLALEETEAKAKQLETELKFLTASEKAQVKINELSLEQTRNEFKRAETNTNRLLVKAPIDGITVMQITFRSGEPGQVQQGDQLWPGQGFMSIIDPRSMVVNAMVNQVDAERLRIGQRARVRFDAYPDLQIPGRVYSVGGIPKSSGMRADWVKEIPVRVKLEKMDSRVLPDLSVAVDVIVDSTDEEAVLVPASSVFEDSGRAYVSVRSGAGWERRPIERKGSNFTHVAIRNGLKPGEEVAEEPAAAAAVGAAKK